MLRTPLIAACCAWFVLAAGAAASLAQTGRSAVATHRAEQLHMLGKPITIEVQDNRLEDVIEFIETYSGAQLEPLWLDDTHSTGLDKDARVTISVSNVTTLAFLERVLDRVSDDFDRATWQVSESGSVQIGPRSRLNRYTRLVIYDVQDLLYQVPNFRTTPALDLDQILQQSAQGGGGGGGSIFQDDETGEPEGLTEEELTERLIEILITNIEPEQWIDNGGDAASLTPYQGTFLIRAPNYIHRKLQGMSVPARAPAGSPDAAGSATTDAETARRRAAEYRRWLERRGDGNR